MTNPADSIHFRLDAALMERRKLGHRRMSLVDLGREMDVTPAKLAQILITRSERSEPVDLRYEVICPACVHYGTSIPNAVKDVEHISQVLGNEVSCCFEHDGAFVVEEQDIQAYGALIYPDEEEEPELDDDFDLDE